MTPQEIADALAEPFEAGEVKFKPQSVKGNRAMAIAYIDARLVMDRLDDVLGAGNWTDEFEVLHDGSVVCRLKLKIGDEWVGKADVGSPSEQPDQGDRLKAAFSDALKRAAVKFGIGRYIYRLGHQWCDYDPQKRAFSQRPQLPPWALPKKKPAKPAPAPYASPDDAEVPPPPAAQPAKTPPQQQQPAKKSAIQSVAELHKSLAAKEAPPTGDDLAKGLAWIETTLARLLPDHAKGDLTASVAEAVGTDEAGLAKLTGYDLAQAWGRAKEYVGQCPGSNSQAA